MRTGGNSSLVREVKLQNAIDTTICDGDAREKRNNCKEQAQSEEDGGAQVKQEYHAENNVANIKASTCDDRQETELRLRIRTEIEEEMKVKLRAEIRAELLAEIDDL
ncbi:hypothetical protein L914_05540 [Phytophthora nicotianae]|uniref:Uncharacterized protein n=1 Tax=Phytophthora nicotianae TaxID=4792 RepID=W2NP61_PHYNI|nr:hypothetical protein L914_05540 [Phytophthora nicotianae]